MTGKPSISVVFPAYNEELNIEGTMKRAVESLEKQFDDYEIIIVNDASTDSTPQIADKLAADNKHIRVLHNEKNLRQGASLVKGFAEARCDYVMHNAMDYPFDLDDLKDLMPLTSDHDIVVACRLQRAGYDAYRHFLSHANLFLLHTLFDLKLRDYNFIQVYKREVLQSLPVKARSTGFLTPELLIRAHKSGKKIAQVDIKYLPREAGVARSGSLKVIRESLRDLTSFWIDLNLRKK